MAGLTHLSVALGSKRALPQTHTIIVVLLAYALDFVFGLFWLFGIEEVPSESLTTTNPYSHGLFMAVIWSVLIGLTLFQVTKNKQLSLFSGIIVFSHWIVDFISHPMTYVFPHDGQLSLLFDGSPTVGLGIWGTSTGMIIGEYIVTFFGLLIYLWTIVGIKRTQYMENPIAIKPMEPEVVS